MDNENLLKNLFYEHHNIRLQNYKGFHTYLIK